MIAAALLAIAATDQPAWLPVGETASRLRIFVDRNSVHDQDGRRRVRVRVGSPTAIVGRIVLVFEDDEFDCAARRWRMLAYEAQDEDGKIVKSAAPGTLGDAMMAITEHTIAGEVARMVCALP